MLDLIVHTDTGDIGVAEGVFAAPGGPARREIDARGLLVLPGGLDPHVHFNEPGRTDWEGFATGSAALAAGGYTACFDMPLNASPPVLDGAAFDAKRAAAQASSCIDFGLWGGLVPGNLGRLEELAGRGVVGFKAFMSDSGIADFPRADDATLHDGMAIAARLDLPVAVHAENEALTRRSRGATAAGWLASRPAVAEVEAIGRALAFAEDTRCALHVVHVSTPRGVELVAEARERGVDATCETCPHHLFLTPADVERLGPVAKCAPPIRGLPLGPVDFVASDHSPCPPDMKAGGFDAAWGGIAGGQSTRELLLERFDAATVARLTAAAPAARFRIAGKGRIEIGADADLAIVDPTPYTLTREHLRDRHRGSPYTGRTLAARVVRTLLRGEDPEPGAGRLLTPTIP